MSTRVVIGVIAGIAALAWVRSRTKKHTPPGYVDPDLPPPPEPEVPPPKEDPYEPPVEVDPTIHNPIGGYPGVQHFTVPNGISLPLNFAGRPPKTYKEAALTYLFGEKARHVFEGATGEVEGSTWPYLGPGPGRYIVEGSEWVPWRSTMGPDVGSTRVWFQLIKHQGWRRISPP